MYFKTIFIDCGPAVIFKFYFFLHKKTHVHGFHPIYYIYIESSALDMIKNLFFYLFIFRNSNVLITTVYCGEIKLV